MPQNAKTSLLLRLLITADGPLLPFLTLQPGKAVIYLRRNAKDRVDDEVTGSWSFFSMGERKMSSSFLSWIISWKSQTNPLERKGSLQIEPTSHASVGYLRWEATWDDPTPTIMKKQITTQGMTWDLLLFLRRIKNWDRDSKWLNQQKQLELIGSTFFHHFVMLFFLTSLKIEIATSNHSI